MSMPYEMFDCDYASYFLWLAQIQDRSVKATAIRVLDSAENKVREIRGHIYLADSYFPVWRNRRNEIK